MKIKLFVVLLFTLLNGNQAYGDGEIKMVFRYDDYTLIPSQFSDSLISIFKRNDIPLCIGVIPYGNDNKLVNQLTDFQISKLVTEIKNKEIEVALHGFTHNNIVKSSFLKRSYKSEFSTLSYSDQYKKLEKGKKVLDSLLKVDIRTFIPPFNTYDKNTLKALDDLGFEIISGVMTGVCSSDKISYMPATYQDFSDLPKMVRKFKDDDITIIIYFHSYSFKGFLTNNDYNENSTNQISLNQLDSLLNWTKKQKVRFFTFYDLARYEKFDKALYKANSINDNLLRKIFNKAKLDRFGVYSTLEYHNKHKELFFGNMLLHFLIFIFVYFFVSLLMKLLHPKLFVVISFFSIFIFVNLLYLYYFSNDYGITMKVIILSVVLLAVIASILRQREAIRSNT